MPRVVLTQSIGDYYRDRFIIGLVIVAVAFAYWPVALILFGLACGFLIVQRIDHGRTHGDNPNPRGCSWCRDDVRRMRAVERVGLEDAELRRLYARHRRDRG